MNLSTAGFQLTAPLNHIGGVINAGTANTTGTAANGTIAGTPAFWIGYNQPLGMSANNLIYQAVATGNISNPVFSIGDQIVINSTIVTLTGTTLSQAITDLKTAGFNAGQNSSNQLTLSQSYAYTMSGQGAIDAGLPANSSYTNQFHPYGGSGLTGGRFITTRYEYHLTGYVNGQFTHAGHLLTNNFDALDNSDLLLCNSTAQVSCIHGGVYLTPQDISYLDMLIYNFLHAIGAQ